MALRCAPVSRPKVTAEGSGRIGVSPFLPYLVSGVIADSAADKAGIREGDEIVAVQDKGKRHEGFSAIAQVSQGFPGSPPAP